MSIGLSVSAAAGSVVRKVAAAAIVAFCAAMMALAATPSRANPFFASQTGRNCSDCHQSGQEMSGTRGLNNRGRSFLHAFRNCSSCALREYAVGSHRNRRNDNYDNNQNYNNDNSNFNNNSGGRFTLRVCNNSNWRKIGVAVSYPVGNGQNYETKGWWHVLSGRCTNMGPFPKGRFWMHAEESDTAFPRANWGSGSRICVHRSGGNFSLEAGRNYSCRGQRVNADFRNIQNNFYTWNLN